MSHKTYIKKNGKRESELFDRKKLHDSIVSTCLSTRSPMGVAQATANSVCEAVIIWLEPRTEVTTLDLRKKASEELAKQHPEAAYLYEQHKITI